MYSRMNLFSLNFRTSKLISPHRQTLSEALESEEKQLARFSAKEVNCSLKVSPGTGVPGL